MKKILLFVFLLVLLVGCSNDKEVSKKDNIDQEPETAAPSQEELDKSLKEEAVQAVFVELNGEDTTQGKKVYATGKVSLVSEDGIFKTFTLNTEENEGNGMYSVVDVLANVNYTAGDTLKIYGTYEGKNDLGLPQVKSTVIEKQ